MQTRNDSNRLEDRNFVNFDILLGDHALLLPNKNLFELISNYYKGLSYFKKNDRQTKHQRSLHSLLPTIISPNRLNKRTKF